MSATRPQDLHPRFEQAFNSGDIDALMALYEPGAVLLLGGEPITGHSRIRDAYAGLLGSARIKLETRMVVDSGEGLALLHGAWTLNTATESQGLSSEVVRRQADGAWKFVIDNPNTPR